MISFEALAVSIASALLAQVFIQLGKIMLFHRSHNAILEESEKQTAQLRLLNRNMQGFSFFTHLNENPMLLGCDLSKHQGTVDWDKLSAATDFVIIRSSFGTGFIDSQFERNRAEARRTGVIHGFYHYAYPNQNQPEAEARWFLSTVGNLEAGEFLALDFEESYSDPVGWVQRFLDTIKAERNGYKPLVYMNLSLARLHDWSPVIAGDYGLWLAHWNYDFTVNTESTQWPFIAIRQYSNKDTIGGISPIDANVFFGNKDALWQYGWQTPVVAVDEPAEPIIVPVTPDPVTEPVEVPIVVTPPVPEPTPTKQPPVSTITLDYTKAGALNGAKHFAKGIVLYAAIGAIQYGLIRLNVWHPDTAVTMTLSVLVGEALQAISKWLKTQSLTVDTTTV